MPEPVLSYDALTVTFATDAGAVNAVKDVTYQVFPGEVLAVVGESGSGKSVSSRTAMGLLPPTATVRGTVTLGAKAVTAMSERELTALRGGAISMVFQEPGAALDPLFTVGFQIGEALRAHSGMKRKPARAKAIELLRTVGLPDPEARVDYYPHQLSGGQKQRVVIAIAIACEPRVIIADEPTTALDVTVQAEILDLLRDLRDRLDVAIVLITHNMGVVADLADRVVVMREGRIVETAPVDQLFTAPRHEYTRALLAAVPKLRVLPDNWQPPADPPGTGAPDPKGAATASAPIVAGESDSGKVELAEPTPEETSANGPKAAGASAAQPLSEPVSSGLPDARTAGVGARSAGIATPGSGGVAELSAAGSGIAVESGSRAATSGDPGIVLEVSGLVVEFPGPLGRPPFRAVDDVSLTLRRGETLGLVGESGSGKSTIGRCVAALQRPTAGSVRVLGTDIAGLSERKLRPLRRRFGFVFQDPATSLNPRLTIGECVAEPLLVHREAKGAAAKARVRALLDDVQLPAGMQQRYPHELSGGQRQRVSLARALVLNPDLLVADEPTSALDVSVQAKVLDLFAELQREYGWACLFISHDLAVVDQLAERIIVLRNGGIVEQGGNDDILRRPRQDYTRLLVAAVPVPDPVEQRRRRTESARLSGAGKS